MLGKLVHWVWVLYEAIPFYVFLVRRDACVHLSRSLEVHFSMESYLV